MRVRILVLVILILGTLAGAVAWRLANGDTPDGTEKTADSPLNSAISADDAASPRDAPTPQRVAYVTTRTGTILRPGPGEPGSSTAAGVVFPVLGEEDGGYWVLDTCNREGWVDGDDVTAGMVPDSPAGNGMESSVFVVDAGHGLPDYGAIGPTGLTETEVNLDVAARLAELLGRSNEVDWENGTVSPGTDISPAASVILTRAPDGPNGGDYELGLTFRATLANAAHATAFVSIHHNTQPEAPLDHPGSEALVSVADPESPRLGALVVQELRAGLSRFAADWMGSTGSGLISRVSADGTDYYTLLERSAVPTAIVEGAYISNPTEEALARTDEFRQAYAASVYRALVRFVAGEAAPIPEPEPTLWEVDAAPRSMEDCRVPSP